MRHVRNNDALPISAKDLARANSPPRGHKIPKLDSYIDEQQFL